MKSVDEMTAVDEIKNTLTEHKKDLSQYRVRKIEIFGSYVRGEQKKGSDVDVLVEFEEDADLFDLTGLGLFLEEKLNQKVDVVPKRALREEIRETVLKEAVPI